MTAMTPSNHENTLGGWVTVTKPVWFRVRGLRELLKTNAIAERRNGHLNRYRETKPLYS